VLNRLSNPANLNGRDQLASILNAMGFKLKWMSIDQSAALLGADNTLQPNKPFNQK
jgi:hypothetical protein